MTKYRIVCEYGINDMYRGWYGESDWNKRIYSLWRNMLKRCYSESCHKTNPTYIDCTCQLELHWLSYFVEHVVKIKGYEYEKFMNGELVLDKDIKTNGKNKEYSIENCMFVSVAENAKQSSKTRDNSYLQGENHPMYGKQHKEETIEKMSNIKKGENNPMYGKTGSNNPSSKKVIQYTKNGELIRVWNCIKTASVELGVNYTNIVKCCRGKRKSTGGFVWKYAEDKI